MSDKVETAPLAVRPYRSVASQRPARPARARRDRRIIEFLNRGVSVAKMTSREKDKVAEKGAQRFEIARCRTEIGARGASLVRRDRLRGLGAAERPSSALSGARNKQMGRARGRKIFLAAKP
jgi:hypothetical protein